MTRTVVVWVHVYHVLVHKWYQTHIQYFQLVPVTFPLGITVVKQILIMNKNKIS